MISLTMTGGKELARALRELPDAVSLKVQRQALRAGAEPMRSHAAALAPRGPDAPHIAENIVIGIPTGNVQDVRDEDAVVAVGPEKKFFYGFFWEYGTIKLPAHPFMRPAFDTQAANSLAVIGQQLGQSILMASKRLFSQAAAQTSRGRGTGVGL